MTLCCRFLLVVQRVAQLDCVAGESFEAQQDCAEIKLRAERRAGELLAVMEKSWGNQHARSHDATKLTDLDITKSQSSRWQTIIQQVLAKPLAKHAPTRQNDTRLMVNTGCSRPAITAKRIAVKY